MHMCVYICICHPILASKSLHDYANSPELFINIPLYIIWIDINNLMYIMHIHICLICYLYLYIIYII